MAGSVYQVSFVRPGRPSVVGEIVSGDSSLDNSQPPPFPSGGRLWGLIGGQHMVAAQRAAAVLLGEQAQVVAVQCGFDLASPFDPVAGQVRVVGRRPARDQRVSDDGSPGEFDQTRDVFATSPSELSGSPNTH